MEKQIIGNTGPEAVENSPMKLLDMVSDQALTTGLARYSHESQMACQSYCQQQVHEGKQENDQLSQESARALEKQCNKQCVKKFFKSYMLFNRLMKEGQQKA
jgi:hypothetical protein